MVDKLAKAGGLSLNPVAIFKIDDFGVSYNRYDRRVAISLGALRRPGGVMALTGILAHEIGHALQWDAHARKAIFSQPAYKGTVQFEAHADALGALLLERSGVGQKALRLSHVVSWGCSDMLIDHGNAYRPAHGDRWVNGVLFRERVVSLAAIKPAGDPVELIGLDAFDERGRVRGVFLSTEPAVAAGLESDAFRRGLIKERCGVPGWLFRLEDWRRRWIK